MESNPSTIAVEATVVKSERVLCYNPYVQWTIHSYWELTILKALELAGAQAKYVACDGLYPECDLFNAWGPRRALACTSCMCAAASVLNQMQMSYEWLGRYVPPKTFQDAQRWTEGLNPSDFESAVYEGAPIGQWVKSSIHSYFRMSALEFENPEMVAAYRRYLYSGAVASAGLTQLIETMKPDVVVLFNGRLSSLRIAFETARRYGIRVIIHERGSTKNSIQLRENEICSSIGIYRQIWKMWKDVPLLSEELQAVHNLLEERREGKNLNWRPFSPSLTSQAHLFRQLALNPKRPIIALFTSSDDEIVAEEGWEQFFPSQIEWIQQTIAAFAVLPTHQLVIRVHPNTGGKNSIGYNEQMLQAMESFKTSLPPNVRIVSPDDPTSTYTLMDVASAGLVYGSTAGLEMCALGKPVLLASMATYHGLPFLLSLEDMKDYLALLARVIESVPSAQVLRLAYRFIYHTFLGLSIPFPLVSEIKIGRGEINYALSDISRLGKDPGLNRVVRCIAGGEAVYPQPIREQLGRASTDEDTYLRDYFAGNRQLDAHKHWRFGLWRGLGERW